MQQKHYVNNSKNKYYSLSKKSVHDGIYFSLMNAMKLLDDCEKLFKTNSSMSSTLGLYIFALEEFGKCLLITDVSSIPNNEYKISINVFDDHRLKINRGLQELPQEFTRYIRGETTTISSTDDGYTLLDLEGRTIARLSPTLGYYLIDGTKTKPTFDVRKDCFHVDWDCNTQEWKINVDLSRTELEHMISQLRQKMFDVFFEGFMREMSIHATKPESDIPTQNTNKIFHQSNSTGAVKSYILGYFIVR